MNRRAVLCVVSGGAFALAVLAAVAGVQALTSVIEPAVLLVCQRPTEVRCTDDFFFGRHGGKHTVGSVLVAAAVLLGGVSGAIAVLAAGKPARDAAPPARE